MAFGDERTGVLIDTPDPAVDELLDEDESTLFLDKGPDSGDVNWSVADPFVHLEYAQPDVSVDTSARYVNHEVIGDITVRQKLGEDPANISIDGLCTKEEANKIDQLTEFPYIELVSNRWSGFAQVASTTTSPHSPGGSQDKDGRWLHTFSIELSEVVNI